MNGTTQAVSGVTLWLSSADQKKLRKVEFERVALPQLSHLYTSSAPEREPGLDVGPCFKIQRFSRRR